MFQRWSDFGISNVYSWTLPKTPLLSRPSCQCVHIRCDINTNLKWRCYLQLVFCTHLARRVEEVRLPCYGHASCNPSLPISEPLTDFPPSQAQHKTGSVWCPVLPSIGRTNSGVRARVLSHPFPSRALPLSFSPPALAPPQRQADLANLPFSLSPPIVCSLLLLPHTPPLGISRCDRAETALAKPLWLICLPWDVLVWCHFRLVQWARSSFVMPMYFPSSVVCVV